VTQPNVTTPLVVRTGADLARALSPDRIAGHRVGFVPTMGALHPGHASLMALARRCVGAGPVVVSIFVNPLQFGQAKDLTRYPRTLAADLEICAAEGVDVVFAPEVDEVYPGGYERFDTTAVTIDPGALASTLEGASRPGHFRGVLTVVAKLFGLVRPDLAVFGEKDYQQLTLIRRMVADLNLGIEVVGATTMRETDGLAMSSRNRFLTPEQRNAAAALSRALRAARQIALDGGGPVAVEAAARAELALQPSLEVDYLVITDPALNPLTDDQQSEQTSESFAGVPGRVLVAAQLGTVRLIDNMAIEFG
jgi:pantoate--beta-alanine ligase